MLMDFPIHIDTMTALCILQGVTGNIYFVIIHFCSRIEPGAPILKRYIIKSYYAFVQIKDMKKFNAPFKEDHQLNKDIDKHLRNPTSDSFLNYSRRIIQIVEKHNYNFHKVILS